MSNLENRVTEDRLKEIARGYFPTSEETIATNSKQPLKYVELNSRWLQFDDNMSDYINDYKQELNCNENGECDRVREIIEDYCRAALKVALSWFGASDKLKAFYMYDDGIIGYIEDYIYVNNMSKYYECFDIVTTVLNAIYDLENKE